jgi:hypothetical protein
LKNILPAEAHGNEPPFFIALFYSDKIFTGNDIHTALNAFGFPHRLSLHFRPEWSPPSTFAEFVEYYSNSSKERENQNQFLPSLTSRTDNKLLQSLLELL